MTCLTDFDCPNYPQSQYESGEYGFHPTSIVVTDDAFAYKVALQHDFQTIRWFMQVTQLLQKQVVTTQ